MRRFAALLVGIPSLLAAQTPALDAAAALLGGKERLLGVRTLVLEGTGDWPSFGQNHTPTANTSSEITSFRRVFDFANGRWFFDQTRVPRFVTANPAPQRVRFGIDGDVAYNINANGVMARGSVQQTLDRRLEFQLHPIGFFQAAYAPDAVVLEETATNNRRTITVTTPQGDYTMLVNGVTGLPMRIERRTYHAMLGDVTLSNELSDWQDASGIRLPNRLTLSLEKYGVIQGYRIARTTVNGAIENIAASDSVRGTVVQAGVVVPNVVVDTLAPGVWRIAGQSHHTIAIEQSNRVVLVEAPLNDARTLAAIARARVIAPPGKPVDMVVNTHHHFDHSGGFRAAVSQGLTVVTHQGNKDFYERVVFPGIHRSRPDALALNPKPLRMLVVGDRHTLRDPLRTIEVHHVPGNPHNGNMLVVYLPAEKILIQADIYNPPAPNAPAPPFPHLPNLIENVQKRGLQVERLVGVHGLPAAWSDVLTAASANR